MTDITASRISSPPRSNHAMLLFVAITLIVTLSISQEAAPPTGSLIYWLLVLPALIFPLFDLHDVVKTAFTWPSILLTGMLAIAGAWHVLAGDAHSVLRLAMLALILTWASSDAARLRISDLIIVYLSLLTLGVFVYLLTDFNKWGPLPGLTIPAYGIWRVSFFPNIAYTAFLSLFVFFVVTIDRFTFKRFLFLIFPALFFVIFSFVRTALIALALYLFVRFIIRNQTSPRKIFWISAISAVMINAAIALSPVIFEFSQNISLVSRLFLRGETGLNAQDIYIQLFRPWVWWQHIQIFLSSPYLMGWGNFDFNALKTASLIDTIDWSDTVSMPTRLLASHGLPALLFIWFSLAQLAIRARELDTWACACFPPIALIAMQWGSVFHPSDPMFILFFLMLVGGRRVFV